MPNQTPRSQSPANNPNDQPDDQEPRTKHRPGEGVTVIPDTGKRGSRPKTDPNPYPPRPTTYPELDQKSATDKR